MVRYFVLITFLVSNFFAKAQEEEIFIRPGLLKASGTISPGKMLNRSVNTTYLSGFLEYHIEKNFSFRGDTYWYVDGRSAKVTGDHLTNASRTYFGAFYHLNKRNWDNYLGFQPGISFIRFATISPKTAICPSFALTVGTSYFVWNYFHFFANLTYVNSNVQGLVGGSKRADELIFSAGLGFQFNTKK